MRGDGKRIFVLGLDGLGLTLMEKLLARKVMRSLEGLLGLGTLREMRSVLPTVSSVAWASYATGVNPGKHGIFGFLERIPDPFQLYIPNGSHLRHETIFQFLGREGLRVATIGVPMTYPPRPVNGIVVGCFLSPSLEKAVYPRRILPLVRKMGYMVDVQASKAMEDPEGFLAQLSDSLDARFRLCLHLLEAEDWDFFQLHVMETDRINHFFLAKWEDKEEPWAEMFIQWYRRLDSWIEVLVRKLIHGLENGTTELFILSDHGFCRVFGEVELNFWLRKNGYLRLGGRSSLASMERGTRAYSITPGRIYLNLKGRETMGSVEEGKEYEELRSELSERLLSIEDPRTGQAVVRRVYRKEEIYSGVFMDLAPDLIVEPVPGFDMKARTEAQSVVHEPMVTGMHTLDDAFLFLMPGELPQMKLELTDVISGIARRLGLELRWKTDGRNW
jgi:predicted AlkP superfamily phosphohydrolase/phosphomutase